MVLVRGNTITQNISLQIIAIFLKIYFGILYIDLAC